MLNSGPVSSNSLTADSKWCRAKTLTQDNTFCRTELCETFSTSSKTVATKFVARSLLSFSQQACKIKYSASTPLNAAWLSASCIASMRCCTSGGMAEGGNLATNALTNCCDGGAGSPSCWPCLTGLAAAPSRVKLRRFATPSSTAAGAEASPRAPKFTLAVHSQRESSCWSASIATATTALQLSPVRGSNNAKHSHQSPTSLFISSPSSSVVTDKIGAALHNSPKSCVHVQRMNSTGQLAPAACTACSNLETPSQLLA
mmetsp:Transcript_35886/g.103131  ORF Transcript_35886/g.103131 Transcript_35886/m.103131 type:complete len:258 (+) Transcript_35886:1730-2503(+)